jgi:hypothetical protein
VTLSVVELPPKVPQPSVNDGVRPLPTPMQPWVADAEDGELWPDLHAVPSLAGTHELGSLAPLGQGVSHVTSHG